MLTERLRRPSTIAILLFAVAALLSWKLTGNYFSAGIDEGIYLNGGRRIAAGERLYVDFFGFVGPVTYWLQAGLYRWFGNHLPELRLSTALSVGAIVAGIFQLGRYLAGTTCGVVGSVLWMAVWLDLPNRMEVNHRWVSMAFYALAMATLLRERDSRSRLADAVAGALVGAAVCTTPSFLVSALLIGLALVVLDRERFLPYLLGAAIACGSVGLILGLQGAIGPFLTSLQWAADNYTQANRFPYGYFSGNLPRQYFLQVYMGAISIPLALGAALGMFAWKREKQLLLPFVLCLALLCTAYPKCDAYSLHFISGPFFVMLFSLLYRLVPGPLRNLAEGLSLAVAVYLLVGAATLQDRLTLIPTRAGLLMGDEASARAMEQLEQQIPARSEVYIYPYLTGLYSLLDVQTHSRLEYLQPGMMTAADEKAVLQDLRQRPPQIVFWQEFPDSDITRIWPSSNPGRHRFTALEAWIREHYQPGFESKESNIRGAVWLKRSIR